MTAVRRSRKREAIYEALRSTKSHPSAEWVYARVKADIPDLSLGTVYRNLARFTQEGRAIRVATVDGQERFDADVTAHAHFICRLCGGVADVFGAPPIAFPQVEGAIDGYQLNYHGVCRRCIENRATEQNERER